MLNRVRAIRDEDKGFTLIELLVVIIIIGILAAIAVPVFLGQRQKGYDAQTRSDLRNVGTAETTYAADQTNFLSCAGAAACSAAGALGGYGYKTSPGVMIAVVADGTNGFCGVAKSQSGKYFVFDSEAGGLAAYNSTTAPTAANDGLSTGACVNVGTYPVAAS